MSALTASLVPLAVRVKSNRYDGMLTGYIHGGVKCQKADPGGYKSASFILDQRLGFRSDMVQDYSRVYFYDKCTGKTMFEGDVSHPGKSVGDGGPLLEVQVDVDRLNDWSGSRIFIDRDMQAWKLTPTTTNGTSATTGPDLGGSGEDALMLAFPNSFHVETNYRAEIYYGRIAEAGQVFGWFNYAWDCGLTNASWLIRSISGPTSTVVRSQGATTSGSGGSGAVWGGSIPDGDYNMWLQFIWTSGASNTGTTDVAWASLLRIICTAKLFAKDGTFKSAGSYNDYLKATDVVGDLLGDILADSFDGANAQVDTGSSYDIRHLAYPDGVTPMQILDDLTQFEPSCTYIVGPSRPGIDKYSFKWMARSTTVRYEAMVWIDEQTGGVQSVDQYNEVASRWTTPAGTSRVTVATQSIPEMTAAGRTRRFFQDLGDHADGDDANQANASVLENHRYPQNSGRVRISRGIVDLFTGRTVQPFEIEPAYMIRLVGVDPEPDALNATAPNGGTVCRIVNTDYSADDHAVDLDLDSVPWSLYRAIAATKKLTTPQRKAF